MSDDFMKAYRDAKNSPEMRALREQFQRDHPELAASLSDGWKKWRAQWDELTTGIEAAADEFCRLWARARDTHDEEDQALAYDAMDDLSALRRQQHDLILKGPLG